MAKMCQAFAPADMEGNAMDRKVAIIFGVSGIVGRAVADRLVADGGWQVVGVSRHRPEILGNIEHVACNLQDEAATARAFWPIDDAHILCDLGTAGKRNGQLPRQW
jgi:nucleoside-diphosphate-sugar epimerase